MLDLRHSSGALREEPEAVGHDRARAPKERPIPFSAPMVRAVLAGTKKQTRRDLYVVRKFSASICFDRRYPPPLLDIDNPAHGPGEAFTLSRWHKVKIGDRLWVREAWRARAQFDVLKPSEIVPEGVRYEATADPGRAGEWGRYRPPMFMPRWASRITLEVTGVRVQRLQDISEADAIAEGVSPDPCCRQDDDTAGFHRIGRIPGDSFPIARYAVLWEQLNGLDSWKANPWVRVVEFRKAASGSDQRARSDDQAQSRGQGEQS